ncbi:EF-P 5-aminopentanol modification-associated protein YfmH [Streptococcus infantis]|uniref:EF-P 5-aminopentanol modification-associated protein YfmH n=1 Tax=Streptococcus infantis TaxID=68892 RepID=UPI0039C227BC
MTRPTFQKKYYPAVKETLYQTSLENGLTVTLLPKKDFNEVYGVVSVQVGSVDTRFTVDGNDLQQYPQGIAHFLEHKLFEREDSGDVMAAFTELGAESNAFTSFTNTSYLFSTSENVLECLDLLEELVTTFNMTEESVEREKDIIQQEREMYQDDPDSCLFFKTLANLYPESPLASDIVGSENSIDAICLEDLEENFKEFYRPVNSNIFLVGNFDFELLEDYFATKSHPQEKKHEFKREKIPLHPVKTTESLRMDVASPKLAIGIRGNEDIGNRDQYRYHLLLKLLFTMMFGWTSQRFQKLYETGKLDASLSLEIEVDPRFHFVILTMDTKEPVALSHQFRKAIRNFVKDEDITEDHLDIVKTEMYGEFLHSMDSLEYIATQYHPTDTGSTLFDLPKLLQEITLEDILEAGHDLIDNSDMVDCTIFPI